IEVQMRLGRITEEEAGNWIKSWVDMGKITRQEALKIAEHLGIMEGGIRDLVYEAMKAGEEVPEQFRAIVDSSKELGDRARITAEAIVNLGRKFKLDADEAINLANKILGLNLTWDKHDQLVKQLVQDYGLTEDQARKLVEAMAREAEEAKRAAEAQKAHDEALKKLQTTLSNLANYGRVLGPFHQAIQDINEALAVLGSQAPSNLQNLLSILEDLDNRFVELEERSRTIAAAQRIAGTAMSYFTTIQEIQEALMADEIALAEERVRMAQAEVDAINEKLMALRASGDATREQIEYLREQLYQAKLVLEQRKQELESLKQSTALTLEQTLSQKRLAAIQQMLAFTSQLVSLQQTAMQLAMMGANNAANMFMNTSMELTKALEDGVITEEEMKQILEMLGVQFDETGKPVINLRNIMEEFRKKMEETRNKVQDFRSTLESLDGLTVHTYHYHHEITVHEERGGDGGGIPEYWLEQEEYLHGYQHGAWYIPRNMPAYLHKGEMVLPRRVAEWFRRGGISRNIVVNVNIHASASSPQDWDEVARIISRKIVSNLRVMT
ncbi:hypothetical protein DRO64_11905, partial [Candidatus Bathyarchaeota archaeon]